MDNIYAAAKVSEIYSNLNLIAISRGYDLGKLAEETEQIIEQFIKDKHDFGLPASFMGLYYIELLANEMNTTLGELYAFTDYQRDKVISDILQSLTPIDKAYEEFFDDDDEDEMAISFGTTISVINTQEKEKIQKYYTLLGRDSDTNIYSYYDIYFEKTYETDESESEYSISITIRKPGRKYIFDSVEVWSGTEGEFADFIDDAINEYNKGISTGKSSVDNEKEESIDFKNFFVYGGEGKCPDNSHFHQEKVMATVPILKKNMKIDDIQFEAWYCPECNTYYISNKTYNHISSQGRLLCQLMSNYEYREFKKNNADNTNLNPQSILNMLGYNVGSKDDYSAKYRQSILASAIETGIITKNRAIEYLEFFIRMNERNSSKKNAVAKWKEDVRYLRGIDTTYREKARLVGIKRIITDRNLSSVQYSIIDEALPFK